MTTAEEALTFKQLAELESGTILHDEFDEGVRLIVMRGPGSLCGYVGVPTGHPLWGFDYDDLPVSAHGGFTYASEGGKEGWPAGWYWYGWDYAHSGDRCFYDLKYPKGEIPGYEEKEWTVPEVVRDSWDTVWHFKKLCTLMEKAVRRQYQISPVLPA